MNCRKSIWLIVGLFLPFLAGAQLMQGNESFTRADTLRGSITKYRQGWDVLHYDLTVQPNFASKSIIGKNAITYNETSPVHTMQIDLQQPLIVDSITSENTSYTFTRQGDVCFVNLRDSLAKGKFKPGIRTITVYYHGVPKEAKKAPWDGGIIWKTDQQGNPIIATACQGLGASVWWPCKDHQSDEPDNGMNINVIAPDTLSAVSNGRLAKVSAAENGVKTWSWKVTNPINTYGVTMNVGNYTSWTDTLMGEGGKLDLEYWVLKPNLAKAKKQFEQVKPMLRSFEHWFGKYPFYEDSYKLIETPFLGMEHQSAVAYGNKYENGYLGRDLSGTGIGLKWDYIIIHESGHEWFGNNITTKDIADMWVHEAFTDYSEVLFIESLWGREEADMYCFGLRKNIKNDSNIIGFYGVNKEGSGDMYYKGANLLHTIRSAMDNDEKFRKILRGLNSKFAHQTVTGAQIEDYISKESGLNLSPVFDQYLRSTKIPVLEYYFTKGKKKMFYRWNNCNSSFNLPVNVRTPEGVLSIKPTQNWQSVAVTPQLAALLQPAAFTKNYYIQANLLKQN